MAHPDETTRNTTSGGPPRESGEWQSLAILRATNSDGNEWVELPDGSRAIAVTEHRGLWRHVHITVRVVKDSSGIPHVTEVRFHTEEGEDVQAEAFRHVLPLDEIRERAMAMLVEVDGRARFGHRSPAHDVMLSRRRQRLDGPALEDVAKAFATGGVRSVQDAMSVSRSQAYRYVRAARETGLLPEND